MQPWMYPTNTFNDSATITTVNALLVIWYVVKQRKIPLGSLIPMLLCRTLLSTASTDDIHSTTHPDQDDTPP